MFGPSRATRLDRTGMDVEVRQFGEAKKPKNYVGCMAYASNTPGLLASKKCVRSPPNVLFFVLRKHSVCLFNMLDKDNGSKVCFVKKEKHT